MRHRTALLTTRLTTQLTARINRYTIISMGLGLVYLWFGLLKFFSGLSPAEDLAGNTIEILSFGLIGPRWGLLLLAAWESAIGILFFAGICRKCVLRMALVHISCTFAPLFLLPGLCFTEFPFGLTLVGQYIIKNVVFVGVLLVLLRSEGTPG